MGIQNRDGALFAATGIDCTGFYEGRREAIGIIKAMASQITSFDVFSSIGISAATAFASAAKSSYDFEKEFHKNMLEVATISTQVEGSMTDFMNQVMSITQEIPITAPEAAKALYQIVSAGHDGAAGMNVLEVAAKAAVGGVTDTVTAADAITTLLNAYKMSASDAEKVSDQLFTTARLGKTTFGEMGQSIAQVAPIAAAYGVEMDQVLAAVATLTKSGTPTAQAMTQIRASIVGVSKYLGDGAFDTMTYQEALEKVSKEANGSESALRAMIPEIEAVNGVLGLTGIKAQDAAEHLNEMNKSAGATEAAFKLMMSDVDKQMTLLSSNIQAALRPMGSAILKNVSEAAQMINEGFKTGQIQNSMESLQKLVIAVAGAFVTYKSAAIGASAAEALHSAKVTISNNLKSLQSQITGEAALSKEKERIHLEAYTASLERSITEEQRAKLAKLDLKAGSQEYMKALSEQALQEKKNADNQVESLTKVVNKNKEKLSSAQDNLEMSHQAVEAAKAELNVAIEANDSVGFEIAQTKLNAAAQREEAASTNVATASKGLKASESRLVTATTTAEVAATRVNTATTVADTAVTNIATTAKNRLKIATLALWGAMKANPLGAILTMVSLASTVYMVFADKVKAAETAQSRLNRLNKAAAESIADEKAELMLLLSVAKNELVSKENRTKAIKKLNEISPEYLSNLSLENISTKETTASIEAYTKAIGRNAKAKALMDEMNPLYRDQLKYEQELYALQKKSDDLKANKLGFSDEQLYYANLDISGQIKNKTEQKASVDKQIQEVLDMYNDELSNETKSKPIKVDIPVNIQIESEQANVTALLKKKEEIESRINKDESNGLFVNSLDAALLVTVNNELTVTNNKLIALNKEVAKPTGLDAKSITKEVEAATQKVSTLKQELTDLRNGKTSIEAGKTVKEVIEGKVKDLKAAEDALSTLTGKDKGSIKDAADRLKTKQDQSDLLLEISRNAKERENAERQTAFEIEQAKIDVMKDGFQKEQAQIDLNHRKALQGITQRGEEMLKAQQEAERKQWEKDGKKGVFTPETTSVSQLPTEPLQQLSGLMNGVVAKTNNDNQMLIDGMVKQYQTYAEKRKEIEKKFDDDIRSMQEKNTDGKYDANIKEAQKQKAETLSGLDIEANKTTSAINKLFGDMKDKTLKDLDAINKAGEEALNFLKNGQWDATTGARLGISEETFETWSKSPDKLKDISDALIDNKKAADSLRPAFDKVSGGLKKIFSSGGDTKKFQEGLADLSEGMNDVMQAGQFLSDSLSELGNAFGNDTLTGIAEGVNVAMDAMGSAMDGAKAGAAFGPWGAAAGAAIGMVTSLASSFAKIHDAKNEKRIAVLQDQIEVLDKTYEKLGESVEKAYSTDASNLINQQNKLLEQQKVLINQQIREEEDKKKTDNDRIKEWREQLEEIDKTLADNKEKAVDAIFGEDLQSAIDNFAQAYADAWASNTDKAKSAKDTVKNMMRQMVTESIKAAIESSKAMEKIRAKLEEFYADKVLTGWEQDYIYNMAEDLQKELDSQFGWADGLMKDENPEEGETRQATAKGFAAMSQNSADALDGKFSSQLIFLDKTLGQVTTISEQMQFIRDLQVKGWEDVRAIRDLTVKVADNTLKVADISGKIEELSGQIATNTKKAANGIQDMNDKGLIVRTK